MQNLCKYVTPVKYVDVVASAKKTNLTQEVGRKKSVGKIACVKKSQPNICRKKSPFFSVGAKLQLSRKLQ
jgi:hypothetical protein